MDQEAAGPSGYCAETTSRTWPTVTFAIIAAVLGVGAVLARGALDAGPFADRYLTAAVIVIPLIAGTYLVAALWRWPYVRFCRTRAAADASAVVFVSTRNPEGQATLVRLGSWRATNVAFVVEVASGRARFFVPGVLNRFDEVLAVPVDRLSSPRPIRVTTGGLPMNGFTLEVSTPDGVLSLPLTVTGGGLGGVFQLREDRVADLVDALRRHLPTPPH